MPSSVVSSFSYNADKAVLRVIYVSGKIYDYLSVPEKVYQQMLAADSKGTFLNYSIKGLYKYKKIK